MSRFIMVEIWLVGTYGLGTTLMLIGSAAFCMSYMASYVDGSMKGDIEVIFLKRREILSLLVSRCHGKKNI